ncbi:MAG: 2-oxo acid dehydrogenase subunit E2 [Candidatus Lokiarchaeota archaeon]|nr:2-oxo acid dehydrogenase subunit E2 [Candidatus Lokiarchaeota archaeon]
MEGLDTYTIKEFSKVRQILSDVYEVSIKKTSVIGLIELDVTTARHRMRTFESETGKKLSFTGWLIKCISQAVSEHKEVHAYRVKKNKIIVFDNVHVSVMVERTTSSGIKVPITYVITSANTKSVMEITDEIRQAQQRKIEEKNQFVAGTPNFFVKLYSLVPRFLRRRIIRKKLSDPWFYIKNAGTVGVTAIGMFGKNIAGWAIPFTSSTLNVAVGGMKSKPELVDGNLIDREFLNLTIQIDHTLVDGAPATRFVSRLVELVESGFGCYQI